MCRLDIDLASNKVRADGFLGHLIGVDPAKLADGVDLVIGDRMVVAEDLEAIRRHRRETIMAPGRYQLMFSLNDARGGDPVPVQTIMNVKADRFGMATRATGVMIRNPVQRLNPANDQMTTETLLRILDLSTKSARQLGYTTAGKMLRVIYKTIAEEAL